MATLKAEMLRDAVQSKERKVVRRSTRECVDELARIDDSVATESDGSSQRIRRSAGGRASHCLRVISTPAQSSLCLTAIGTQESVSYMSDSKSKRRISGCSVDRFIAVGWRPYAFSSAHLPDRRNSHFRCRSGNRDRRQPSESKAPLADIALAVSLSTDPVRFSRLSGSFSAVLDPSCLPENGQNSLILQENQALSW